MVLGAGWAGCALNDRDAGPGISLMAEFAGLAYYAEVPGVIWDIQRVGPSTGLPTRTSQGDILSTAFLRTATRKTFCSCHPPWLNVSLWRRTLSIWRSNFRRWYL